jgi:MerR family transcriptional regulator, light-induced transcriptional regulator
MMTASHTGSDGGFAGDDRCETLFDALSERLASRDKPGAVAAAVTAVRDGEVTIDALYRDVLAPLLVGVGSRWQAGQMHVWEEHFVAATVRTIIEALYVDVQKARISWPPIGRTVVLACPPDETHDIGLRMLADRFEMVGWTAFFLGPDAPVAEVVQAARDVEADLVCLSVSTHFHRLSLRETYDTVHAQLPGVMIAVGGPAFARERDGWTADEVVDVESLLDGAEPGVGGDGPV